MKVFHATYKNRKGKLRKTKTWYAELRDPQKVIRRFALFEDKKQSEIAAKKIEKLIVHAINREPPDRELSEWLEKIPDKLKDRLVEFGVLDPVRAAANKTLVEHLREYRQYITPGNTAKHVTDTVTQIERILKATKSQYFSEISASRVKEQIDGFHKYREIVVREKVNGRTVKRKEMKNLGPISNRTKNYHLASIKRFCSWMVKDKRATESPIEYLDKFKADDDEHRRALWPQEIMSLLDATEAAKGRHGMTGHERAVLYLLTIETGLRVRELQSLQVSSFDFDEATVRVEARFCKNRKRAVQFLKCTRADQLKNFFAGKTEDAGAFNIPSSFRTATMLKEDLAEAGIEYIDDAGRKADFHCLRHTLATALDQSGASLKERMTIMRHSDKSNLTLGTYTHSQPYNIRRAIENLPDYGWPGEKQTESETLKATGTDDTVLHENLQEQTKIRKTKVENSGQFRRIVVDSANADIGGETGVSDSKTRVSSDIGPVAQRQSSGLIIHWS